MIRLPLSGRAPWTCFFAGVIAAAQIIGQLDDEKLVKTRTLEDELVELKKATEVEKAQEV